MRQVGLISNFIGVMFLLNYFRKTLGAVNQVDRDELASVWWNYWGYIFLALGFLFQIVANSLSPQ